VTALVRWRGWRGALERGGEEAGGSAPGHEGTGGFVLDPRDQLSLSANERLPELRQDAFAHAARVNLVSPVRPGVELDHGILERARVAVDKVPFGRSASTMMSAGLRPLEAPKRSCLPGATERPVKP
jgi:hypothetical protein